MANELGWRKHVPVVFEVIGFSGWWKAGVYVQEEGVVHLCKHRHRYLHTASNCSEHLKVPVGPRALRVAS